MGKSDEEKGAKEVSGWSDLMDGKMDNTENKRKTVSAVSDMWSLWLLDHQALSDFLFPECPPFPSF